MITEVTGPYASPRRTGVPGQVRRAGKPGAYADEPWEGDHVAKVGGKIFVFGIGSPGGIGVKCGADRAEADEWLRQYPEDASVMAYIGRNGWNSLKLGGTIPVAELVDAVDASYELIVAKLPKSKRPAS
jgi:predicted DNA-binding protein (MmcQ/YjbR family)